jgi:hypothetical protein
VKAPREIIYRYFALPYPTRMCILRELALLTDDRNLTDGEIIQKAIALAAQTDKLDAFIEAVNREHDKHVKDRA